MQKQSIWYKIDYLTSQPSLYIFGQDKLQTKTGLFFSFLVIVLSFSFSIYFLIDFFQRKEPSILYLKESTSTVREFNLSDSLFMLQLINNTEPYQLMLKVVYIQIYANTVKATDVSMERCNKYTNVPKKYWHLFDDGNIGLFYCLTPGQNLIIKDDPINKVKTQIQAMVYLCDNETNALCDTKENIINSERLKKMTFAYTVEKIAVNHLNTGNPYSFYTASIGYSPSVDFTYEEYSFWELISYQSDDGYIFEDKKIYKAAGMDSTLTLGRQKIRTVEDFEVPVMTFQFSIYQNYSERYIRSYAKLQNVIADISGVITFIRIVGSFCINFLVSNMYYSNLGRAIFEDNTVYKRTNSFNRMYKTSQSVDEDKKQIKITNNSSLNNPSIELPYSNNLIKLKQISKVRTIPFGNKKKSYEINFQKESSDISGKKNYYNDIKLCDLILAYLPCYKSSQKNIIDLSERMIRYSLSTEELIKKRIQLIKLIGIIEEDKHIQLYKIKPDFFKEIDNINKIEKEEEHDLDSYI